MRSADQSRAAAALLDRLGGRQVAPHPAAQTAEPLTPLGVRRAAGDRALTGMRAVERTRAVTRQISVAEPQARVGRDPLGEERNTGSSGVAGAIAISCELNPSDLNNEVGIGALCTGASMPVETAACGMNFCTKRVLADRWPVVSGERGLGHCSKHCQSEADCGSGFVCCEARRGPFCVRYRDTTALLKHDSGCSERCETNHLGCAEEEICCENLGSICVSQKCDGVCLQ
jgi:hypothetical protein